MPVTTVCDGCPLNVQVAAAYAAVVATTVTPAPTPPSSTSDATPFASRRLNPMRSRTVVPPSGSASVLHEARTPAGAVPEATSPLVTCGPSRTPGTSADHPDDRLPRRTVTAGGMPAGADALAPPPAGARRLLRRRPAAARGGPARAAPRTGLHRDVRRRPAASSPLTKLRAATRARRAGGEDRALHCGRAGGQRTRRQGAGPPGRGPARRGRAAAGLRRLPAVGHGAGHRPRPEPPALAVGHRAARPLPARPRR